MSPTGLKPATGSFYKGVEILCLDKWQRLPFNFAVNADGKYTEFRNLAAARKFIRAAV
jgi:hypothetical protein